MDRFLVPIGWLDLFPECVEMALSRPTLDHYPISLELGLEDWGPPPFRLEMMSLKENSFIDNVWMGFQLV